MEVCLETGRVGCAKPGVGGAAVRSVVGGSVVGDGTSDLENMKNFGNEELWNLEIWIFGFFLVGET